MEKILFKNIFLAKRIMKSPLTIYLLLAVETFYKPNLSTLMISPFYPFL